MAKEKAVLAYSGGLDTSVILTYLKENYNYDVIAVCVNVGQEEDFDAVEKKAYATGAEKAYIVDVTEELVTDYIWPTLKAGAVYENDYLLGTSFARPADREGTGQNRSSGRRCGHRSRLHGKVQRSGSF